VLSNLLLSGVHNQCQSLRCFLFLQFFYLINMGQSFALSVSVCSGVAFHCIQSLRNLIVASMSSSVSRETFEVNLSFIRGLKSVCLLLKLSYFSWFCACVFSTIKPGE
jgi:hypothetical protein